MALWCLIDRVAIIEAGSSLNKITVITWISLTLFTHNDKVSDMLTLFLKYFFIKLFLNFLYYRKRSSPWTFFLLENQKYWLLQVIAFHYISLYNVWYWRRFYETDEVVYGTRINRCLGNKRFWFIYDCCDWKSCVPPSRNRKTLRSGYKEILSAF